jgi:hypothetical protein
MNADKKRINIHSKTSEKRGIAGILESFVRRFRMMSFGIVMAPIGFLYIFSLAVSLWPGIYGTWWVYHATADVIAPLRFLILAATIAGGYIAFAFILIFVVPFCNFILPFRVKPFRGNWFSLESIPWYYHNALTQLVRYTVLDMFTPTPFNLLFYKMMGMKIGKGTFINTSNISDPGLIELGDYVTIGGSAHIFAHYAQKGFLIVSPVKIERGAMVGLKASIMGDVIIGENASVAAHELVLPKSRIPGKARERE